MALLSQMFNGNPLMPGTPVTQGMNPMGNPIAQYMQMQGNPFTRQIPGSQYLGMPQQQMQRPPMLSQGQGMGEIGNMPLPPDFAGQTQGFPNIKEDLQGFGFGAFAPKVNENGSFRENLIKQLLSQMSMQGMPGGF